MHLSPKEIDKLMLHNAGFLAQKRYARGIRLNYVETIALISAQVLEFIRDGDSVAELMEKGKLLLGFSEVMAGVERMVDEVQVEGTFPDGTKLVTIHQPVCRQNGDAGLALYGSGLTRVKQSSNPAALEAFSPEGSDLHPGTTLVQDGEIELNTGRKTIAVVVTNHGDRPVQVGSHYPFIETNPQLEFDRSKTFGMRLDIPAGTAVRFEPGEKIEVHLVEIAGDKKVFGGNAIISGGLDDPGKALEKLIAAGFTHKEGE